MVASSSPGAFLTGAGAAAFAALALGFFALGFFATARFFVLGFFATARFFVLGFVFAFPFARALTLALGLFVAPFFAAAFALFFFDAMTHLAPASVSDRRNLRPRPEPRHDHLRMSAKTGGPPPESPGLSTAPARARPGLRKAPRPPLVQARRLQVARAVDGRLRELLERADVMTEGKALQEAAGWVWYGSTSVILRLGGVPEEERTRFCAVARHDLHVRARVVRLAHREASLRAPRALGRVSCELRFLPAPEGLRIDVDVQAPLIERRRARSSP